MNDPRTLFDLSGKVALVTGGSRGLGRAIVHGIAAMGGDVVIASRSLESCEELATAVRELTGRRALPVGCHVGRWADLDSLVDAAYAEFGRVDILVNNAGMSPVYDDLAAVSEELWDKVLNVNLRGPFRLSALIGTRMAHGDGGAIVNISSASSRRPTPDVIPYAAAKAGVNAMTHGLAHAFGPKVRVNCVIPGTFLTDVSKHWDMDWFDNLARTVALQRGGEPEEIVGAVLYFASQASSYTTGALLDVDGGWS
jgi:NAD(P)-dependent dehydrogenase (short-subunit alcohol dehydrogenase family)